MAKIADQKPRGKLRGQRHTASVAPVAVSQANCEAALGIPPRKHLDLVRELQLPHTRVGSLLLVRLDDYLAALARRTVAGTEPANDAPSIDDVRAALGVAKR